MNLKTIVTIIISACCMNLAAQRKTAGQITRITVGIPSEQVPINPMIYGQMLEDCNDKVIYGGVVGERGEERPHVTSLLKELKIPVVRWPAGTYIFEYDWEKGIGPKKDRPVLPDLQWGGYENHQFGTDEFLAWCKDVGTVPYINFNMANKTAGGSLGDALNWLEYVNGSEQTPFGYKRSKNGHTEPYGVKYWCIGNENYLSTLGERSSAGEYANELKRWATVIKNLYPDLHLLGVGHTSGWNDTVLSRTGNLIDWLTLHYYMRAKVKDGRLQEETLTTFAPAKVEIHIRNNADLLKRANSQLGRTENPIRFSIDEWNCRHSVFENGKYSFTRNDARRQFDVATVAGMLNVFVRQSSSVGMANYIFPVNGHGLVKTLGENDAYRTPPYYVFELFRNHMTGIRMDISVEGPVISLPLRDIAVEGSIDKNWNSGEIRLTLVDGAVAQNADGSICVTLVNRSPTESHKIRLRMPEGYKPEKMWQVESAGINDDNTPLQRDVIIPRETVLTENRDIVLSPCGFALIRYVNDNR